MLAIQPPPPYEARVFLASVPLFRDLADEGLDEVAGHLDWMSVPGGHAVWRQGEDGDGLYLVYRGRLSIVRELVGGETVVLGQVGRGESFGEVSALTGNHRSATVSTLRDSVLARLSRTGLRLLLDAHPKIALALTRRLAGWLAPSSRTGERRSCLAVAVAATREGIALPEIARDLADALSAIGPTLHLTSREMDERFAGAVSDQGSGHGPLGAWLDEQETRYRFVLYEADPRPSAWTRRCLSQADRVLVVANADQEPDLGPLADELPRVENRSREELVLLHDGRQRPKGTARWLALRPFARHHHLRPASPNDFSRIARFLNGTAVGLVLGGGGARGFAHIGVMRALDEAGVPIDRVGGTSMGAVMAALYARGFDWKEMVRLNRWGWVKYQPHKLFNLPLISLISTRKAERMLKMMFGDAQMEDLWLSFFCVSTNLTRAELNIHRKGSLRHWVSASMRIPGVVPPVVENGDLLVDGGVLDNLPIDVMRRLGDGPVIAVDVSATIDVRADPSYREAPNPWQLLLNRWRRTARPFPNIVQLIHRSAVLASDIYAKQAKHEVELYLDLPMDRFDMFDVEPLDEIVEAGYQYARQQLAEKPWKPETATRVTVV